MYFGWGEFMKAVTVFDKLKINLFILLGPFLTTLLFVNFPIHASLSPSYIEPCAYKNGLVLPPPAPAFYRS
ncbi:MAG: hypothetical protein Kow0080_03820 [Candidatus Promineifilaceae bacterium]